MRLVFSAPVEEAFLTLRVLDADGRVVSGRPRRDPRLARAVVAPVRAVGAGEMRVEWRVLSQDGHPSGGVFTFGVARAPRPRRRRDARPLRSRSARRWSRGCSRSPRRSGMLGLVVLAALVVGPAVRTGGIVAPGEPSADAAAFRARATAALAGASRGWWRAWWALVRGRVPWASS